MLHADEVASDEALVARLVAEQFPELTGAVRAVPGGGTVNAVYRLGDGLAVRMPRTARGAEGIAAEQHWLRVLGPRLPLPVPVPVAAGVPGAGFPLPWSIHRWLPGVSAAVTPISEVRRAAVELGAFVSVLRGLDASGAPPSFRGGPLPARDAAVRASLPLLAGEFDVAAVEAAWEAALAVPPWTGRPVWTHSDLLPGNLLVTGGRVTAVLDFGAVGAGDPACDTMPAWTVLPAQARAEFRASAGVDDATWARGRGWALSMAVLGVPYYRVSDPVFAAMARRTIDEVLGDR